MTLEEVASRIGAKGKSTVNSWERGTTKPREQFLNALSELFSVSTDYLKYGSLQPYLIRLILDDYQRLDSVTYFPISTYLNYTTERLSFIDKIPPAEENEINDADVNEISEILDHNLDDIVNYLGDGLRYGNDQEILQKVKNWFINNIRKPMKSFLGEYRHFRHKITYVPSSINFSDKSISDIQKELDVNSQTALDIKYKSKLGDLYLKMVNDLENLKKEYEDRLKSLKK